MLVGIISDSHGRHLAVRKALELFDELGVEHIIHCGDVCGESVFDELIGRPCTFVWGNMDMPDPGAESYLKSVGIPPPQGVPTRIELGGKRFAIYHGHERVFERAAAATNVDYICHGHTHVARDERINGMRIINPGALYRANPKTIATLDTTTDELTFHEISEE